MPDEARWFVRAGALAVGLLLSACGGHAHRPATTSTSLAPVAKAIAPWVGEPAPAYNPPPPSPIPYPTQAQPCRADQLKVSRGRTGAALGTEVEGLKFTNVRSAPCLLRGFPTISGVRKGVRVPLPLARRPGGAGTLGALVPADMAPGGHVFLDVTTSEGCQGGAGSRTLYRDLVVHLPDGGAVRGGKLTLFEQCGLEMSQFGLPERTTWDYASPGSPGALRVAWNVPPVARAGTTLHYVITLVNPTSTDVRLSPCPSFSEALYTSAATKYSFSLNCRDTNVIRAHSQARFAMQLALPPDAPAGPAKIGWSLNTPTGPYVGGVIQIG